MGSPEQGNLYRLSLGRGVVRSLSPHEMGVIAKAIKK
nr:MAG TPA: hypothetical protein [Caudoviricetes sp.]